MGCAVRGLVSDPGVESFLDSKIMSGLIGKNPVPDSVPEGTWCFCVALSTPENTNVSRSLAQFIHLTQKVLGTPYLYL